MFPCRRPKQSGRTGFWTSCALTAALLGTVSCRRVEKPTPVGDLAAVKNGSSSAAAVLVPGGFSIAPGQAFTVGVEFTVPARWHTYWSNPGETGLAPSIAWRLPEGVRPLSLEFPVPQRFEEEGIVSFGYEGTVRLLAGFESAAAIPSGPIILSADVDWMICKEMCLPVQSAASVTLIVDSDISAFQEDTKTTAWRQRLPRPSDGWILSARREEGGVRLRIVPLISESSPSSQEWTSLRVIPMSNGGMDLAADTAWDRDGEAWTAFLASGMTPYGPGDPLEAVLTSGTPGDWKGWQIKTIIE